MSQNLQLRTIARNLRGLLTSGVSRAMENQSETPSITAQEIGWKTWFSLPVCSEILTRLYIVKLSKWLDWGDVLNVNQRLSRLYSYCKWYIGITTVFMRRKSFLWVPFELLKWIIMRPKAWDILSYQITWSFVISSADTYITLKQFLLFSRQLPKCCKLTQELKAVHKRNKRS